VHRVIEGGLNQFSWWKWTVTNDALYFTPM